MNYELIKTLCTRRGVSVKELCRAIDYTEVGFYRMIKKNTMPVITLEKISAVLKVSPALFFKEPTQVDIVNEPEVIYETPIKKQATNNDSNELIDLLRFKIVTLEAQLASLKSK